MKNSIIGLVSSSHNHLKITNYEKYQNAFCQVISSKNVFEISFCNSSFVNRKQFFCVTVLMKWAKFLFNCSFRNGLGSNFQAAVFLWITPSVLFATRGITKCHNSS